MKAEFTESIAVLDKCMSLVSRVHGDNHPELKDVLANYLILRDKLEKGEDCSAVAAELKRLSNGFSIPSDACVTYEKVYKALEYISSRCE